MHVGEKRNIRLEIARFFYKSAARLSIEMPKWFNRIAMSPDPFDIALCSIYNHTQYAHPDIVFHDGRFLLAATPYPFGIDLYENPEVFESIDGKAWSLAFSVHLAVREKRYQHLSDPDLFFYNNIPYLIYRKCKRSGPNAYDELYLQKITLGVPSPRLLLIDTKGSLLSPSAVVLMDCILLFAVSNMTGKAGILKRYIIDMDFQVQGCVDVTIEAANVWHIDIIPWEGRLVGVFLLTDPANALITSLTCYFSDDLGLSWRFKGEIPVPLSDCRRVYRSSLLAHGSDGTLYVSYEKNNETWHMQSFEVQLGDDGISFPIIDL
jgi:hypothetical protein